MPTFQNQATLYTNNSVTRSNVVTGQINEVLAVTKTAVMGDYIQGDDITYVITIINSSQSAQTDVTVTDDLGAYTFGTEPDEITLYPLEYTEGSVLYYVNGMLQPTPSVEETQPLQITGINIPAGGNVTIIYEATATVFADPTVEGEITNTVNVTGCADAEASETITTSTEPDLTISKAVCPGEVNECDEITYTFVIQNHGNTEATEEDGIYIVDEFDPALNITSVTLNGDIFTEYTYEDNVFTTNIGAITVPAATFEQDATTGSWIVIPGVATVTVTGTI